MTGSQMTKARRLGVLIALSGVGLLVSATAASAAAVPAVTGPVVTADDSTAGCNGVVTTPGSENTSKTLVGGSMQPGGTAVFNIEYPVDPADLGQTFTIHDCVFIDGEADQSYTISFVPNNAAYVLEYQLVIPDGTPLGAEYCNYAKTTGSPSHSQASNRKANPACFNVGGTLRIEKRADSADGPLLPGATFSVSCDADASSVPPLVIDGLDEAGVATTGVIGINGPEGTSCEVTEVAAPEGYTLATDASRTLTIPRGEATTEVFVNTASDITPSETPSVTPSVTPSETPSEEPSVEPTALEPGDPTPSISPTVLGVKIVRHPTSLPKTGAPTGLLVATGLALVVGGIGLASAGGRYARQH